MRRPRVSIIVLCRDRWADTARCLAAVRRRTRDYELLVYDNGSRDGTPARLRKAEASWPELRVFENRVNVPFAKAVNAGMRAARGRYVLWLNNDAVAGPGWLDGLIAALERSGAAAAGPMTDHMAPPQQLGSPAGARPARTSAAFLGGFCFLLRRDVLERVGALDERFEWGWEDVDYCLRLRQAGLRLALARDVFVAHAGGRTMSLVDMPRRRRQDRRNRRLLLRKWAADSELRRDLDGLLRHFPSAWSAARPEVSVIVAGTGPAAALARTLDAARREAEGLSCEVIAPHEESMSLEARRVLEDRASAWPALHLAGKLSAPGESGLVNRLVRAGRGGALVILKPGVSLAPGAIRRLLAAGRGVANAGAVAPVFRGADLPWQRPAGRAQGPVPFVQGPCLLVKRSAWDQVGELDERLSGEEAALDLSLRLSRAGFQLLVEPKAAALVPRAPRRSAAAGAVLRSKWSQAPWASAGALGAFRGLPAPWKDLAPRFSVIARSPLAELAASCAGSSHELAAVEPEAGATFARAVNRAAALAAGEFIAIVDGARGLSPGWLERLAEAADTAPNGGASGPSWGRRSGPVRPVAALSGCCLLIRRSAWRHVGELDERFHGAAAYADYCLRLLQSGFQLFETPTARGAARPSRESPERRAGDRSLLLAKWAGHPLWTRGA